jgi:hypothetical protein
LGSFSRAEPTAFASKHAQLLNASRHDQNKRPKTQAEETIKVRNWRGNLSKFRMAKGDVIKKPLCGRSSFIEHSSSAP